MCSTPEPSYRALELGLQDPPWYIITSIRLQQAATPDYTVGELAGESGSAVEVAMGSELLSFSTTVMVQGCICERGPVTR